MEFKEVYENYWPKVFRLCMGYTNNEDWAKDIAQDTFVAVWKNLPGFRNEAAIGTWIYRIAVNQCLRQIEKESRLRKSTITADVPAHEPTTVEADTSFLYHCIGKLPEIERIIISLELEDIKQSEIASIVGISEANVRVKIHRIKEKLTKQFENHEN